MTEDLNSLTKTGPQVEPKIQDFKHKISKHDHLHKQFFSMKKVEAKLAHFKEKVTGQ